MDAKTTTALKASIAHWEAMASGSSDDEPGRDACALCDLFWTEVARTNDEVVRCPGCPVFARTHRHGCERTPFNKASQAYDVWEARGSLVDKAGKRGDEARWREAAARELAFLKALLT